MHSKKRGGFFGNRRRIAVAAVFGVLLLAAALFLLPRLNRAEPEEEEVPNPVATITMESGKQMRFELFPDKAPNTVANFISLANSGFYDGTEFYRIVAGVFIQGGDPDNDGTGGPNYAIKGEFAENGMANDLSHLRGTLSMARQSGYDTAGSQFFIMQGSYTEYDGYYAAFGRAADEETLTVLDSIASQPTDSTYLPLTRQVIRSIRVETFGADYPDPETLDRG